MLTVSYTHLSGETDEKIVEAVTTIINSVKEQGDEAVREFTARFDGIVPVSYTHLDVYKRQV